MKMKSGDRTSRNGYEPANQDEDEDDSLGAKPLEHDDDDSEAATPHAAGRNGVRQWLLWGAVVILLSFIPLLLVLRRTFWNSTRWFYEIGPHESIESTDWFPESSTWEKMHVASDDDALLNPDHRLSVSMSDDGKVLAIASPREGAWVFVEEQDSYIIAVSDFEVENTAIATVEVSGDGNTLALGVPSILQPTHFATIRQPTTAAWLAKAMVFRSVEKTWKKFSRLSDMIIVKDSSISAAVDLSFNYNGTQCAVGTGETRTTQASYQMGNRPEWKFKHFRPGMTQVIQWEEDQQDWNTHDALFDSNYQIDNFGPAVQMSREGTRVIQSTEHDNQNHQANTLELLPVSTNEYNWYGTMDLLILNGNRECQKQISDVGVSADGTVAVVSVQCLKGNQVTFITYSYEFPIGDSNYGRWNTLGQPIVRQGGDALAPFSITLSGDASTLVLAANGALEFFAMQDGKTWKSVERIVSDTETEFSVALSKDGSRIAVGTIKQGERSFGVYRKRQ